MFLTPPERKAKTARLAPLISTCSRPSLSSGQRCGDCDLWSCRPVLLRFKSFWSGRVRDVTGQSPLIPKTTPRRRDAETPRRRHAPLFLELLFPLGDKARE